MNQKPHLKIESVLKGSYCDVAGLKSGDCLLEINGHDIRDVIDFQFYSSEPELEIKLLRDSKEKQVHLRLEEPVPLGLEFGEMTFGHCGNRCQFCFIDQNPKGMREPIYVKDEDFRLSFMFGNYVTLTRVNQEDLNRIVEQRLLPLYISVHAVDPEVRKDLLGLKKDDHLLEKLSFLKKNHIEMHGQIVLCPGINDREVLDESIQTLAGFYPEMASLAIVPVGLTRHRQGLPKLERFTKETAPLIIDQVGSWQKKMISKFGKPFVYLSDEFYLLSQKALPDVEHYGSFPQVDNGVGMTALFLDEFYDAAESFPEALPESKVYHLVSGRLAAPVLEREVLPVLNQIQNLEVQLHTVTNHFYGKEVTVSGLLVGKDILNQLKNVDLKGDVLLPPNCINANGVFLDDLSPDELSRELNQNVIIIEDFAELWNLN